jgi:hypothetical protein
MSEHTGELVSVKIIPNDKGNPPGKLADAEVVFEADAGPLSGLKRSASLSGNVAMGVRT